MTVSCPGCGTRYEVSHLAPQSVFQCRKCNSKVTVPEKGAGSADPVVPTPDAGPPAFDPGPIASARSRLASNPALQNTWATMIADPGLTLFIVGMVFLVLAFTLALIDQAAVSRADAKATAARMAFERTNEAKYKDRDDAQLEVAKARKAVADAQQAEQDRVRGEEGDDDTAKDRAEKTKKAQEAQNKAEKKLRRAENELTMLETEYRITESRKQQAAVNEQVIDADLNRYWYSWLQLPGFLCLFLGCVAFLASPGIVKRIVGAILLVVTLGYLLLWNITAGNESLRGGGRRIETRPVRAPVEATKETF